jgi:predicted nucleic acid-binding protein
MGRRSQRDAGGASCRPAAVIVVDSSVWIAHLRGLDTAAARKLFVIGDAEQILVGDLVLLEVLQGARSEAHARRIERDLTQFPVVRMLSPALAVQAARNYRRMRDLGVTVRKTIDIIIATFCIAGRHRLLHDDRDFEPMTAYLGLRVV